MNKMIIYSLEHGKYKFVFRIKEQVFEIYVGGWREKILEKLPTGYNWDNLEEALKRKEDSELALKFSEMFKKSLEEKTES